MYQILEEVEVCSKILWVALQVAWTPKNNINFASSVWCKNKVYFHKTLAIYEGHKKFQNISLKIFIVETYLES